MPDEIPLPPLPSAPTRPPLTLDMRAEDKAAGTSPPGAGGWTPQPRTLFLLGGVPASLGALAVSVVGAFTGTPYQLAGVIVAAVLTAGALYVNTLIGGLSAGPRKPQ